MVNLSELPVTEKIKLVEALWDSIADEQNTLKLTDDQRSELDRRLDMYEADKIKGRMAAIVISDIRKRL
ncbi:MAG: addiction module protein [Thermodesulfobacteriota bacterium]